MPCLTFRLHFHKQHAVAEGVDLGW
jgi:hypothetical protein